MKKVTRLTANYFTRQQPISEKYNYTFKNIYKTNEIRMFR